VRLKLCISFIACFVVTLALPIWTTAKSLSAPKQHFVCDGGYILEQFHEELVVLKNALAKYPIGDLGEWTWGLVRSRDWQYFLSAHQLHLGVPALTDLDWKTTLFDEALVAASPERLSELMEIWHMGQASLLDFAIRHELGHALCNVDNELKADRVAQLLEQKKPVACKTKVAAKSSSTTSNLPGVIHGGVPGR
jgi:hypothetical protein